jgi:hypothetical protein
VRPIALLAALLITGCAARVDPPRAIVLEDIRARPESRAEFVNDYESAMISIAAITEKDLGLPKLQGVLHLVADRDAFYTVLQESGADPATARGAADTMLAVGTHRAVYVNQAAFARLNWNARLAILSHEAAHAAQYELAGGRRGNSEQWLREGFADWVQAHVLEKLQVGTMTRESILQRNSRFIAQQGMREQLPPLSKLSNFAEWVAVANSPATKLLYPYAYVATDFLIKRHSLDEAITYFRLFATSENPQQNFRQAFGEDRATFDAALRDHVAQLRSF